MAKRIYLGNGSARNVKSLYIGVNGAARRIKAGYIGNANIARKFWPKGYIWNYYTVSNVYRDVGWYGGYYSIHLYGTFQLASAYTFNRNTGMYTISASNIKTYQYLYEIDEEYEYGYELYFTDADDTGQNPYFEEIECSAGTFSSIYEIQKTGKMQHDHTFSRHRSELQDQQIGSYIGQVISENRNAYPDNGISGSYWYVYQGEA